MLTFAPLESARFGVRVYRGTADNGSPRALFNALVANRVDLAILRVAPTEGPTIRALGVFGIPVIQADTLVTHVCDLQRHTPQPAKMNGFSIRPALPSDREEISALIRSAFAEYSNHYTANPLLARADILDGYSEWAMSHLAGNGRLTWVAVLDRQIGGIACNDFDPATGRCEGVLHGVHRAFARRGIYTALIRYTQAYFRTRGYSRLYIKTQARNLAVQQVWAREGFTVHKVQATFHINALLDFDRVAGHAAPVRLDATTTAGLLEAAVRGLASEPGAPQVTASILAAPVAQQPCTLQLHRYALPHADIRNVAIASVRDATGRLCILARTVKEACA